MTKAQLQKIDDEVTQIDNEIEWRDPNTESDWFNWAQTRLDSLERELKDARHLKLVNGDE